LIYEEFHRHIVISKMKKFHDDPIKYYKEEWGCSSDGDVAPPEPSSEDLSDYSLIETQFMKQFFSIKA
jgi:hypothetical protein